MVVPVVADDEDGVEREWLNVYFLTTGDLIRKIKTDQMPFNEMFKCSYRGKENVIALVGSGMGFMLDVNAERLVAKVNRWNNECTSDGKLGEYASCCVV